MEEHRDSWCSSIDAGVPLIKPPSKARMLSHLESIITDCFWASLKTEEGRHHQFRVTYSPPDRSGEREIYIFDQPVPFDAAHLAKLAPAVESIRTIGVWPQGGGDKLTIWGFLPSYRHTVSLQLTAFAPGEIVLTDLSLKAAVTAEKAMFVDWIKSQTLADLFGGPPGAGKLFRAAAISNIALGIRSHRHGGTLLVTSRSSSSLETSIVNLHELSYYGEGRGTPPKNEGDAATEDLAKRLERSRERAEKAQHLVAQLTAVDGATLITREGEILGFGGTIVSSGMTGDSRVLVSAPFEDDEPASPKRLADLNVGHRHKSAAKFVFDRKDALAIVASADGPLSVFWWDEKREMVSMIRQAEFLLF